MYALNLKPPKHAAFVETECDLEDNGDDETSTEKNNEEQI